MLQDTSAMSATYDVLGDPCEYWLSSQRPKSEPATEHKQKHVAQRIEDLPEDIGQVVSHLDQQYASAILSAYQRLQLSRYSLASAHTVKTASVPDLVLLFHRRDDSTSGQSAESTVSPDRSAEVRVVVRLIV